MQRYEAERQAEKPFMWIPTSSRSFYELDRIYHFPEDMKGKSVLDICGGGSDLVATLLEKGANAYSIDRIYSQPIPELKKRFDWNIESLTNKFGESFEPIANRQKAAYERFFVSMKTHPNHYITGDVKSLPFPNDSFDYVVSHKGIIPYAADDMSKLSRAVQEAIRVTVDWGRIEFFPALEPVAELDQVLAQNLQRQKRAEELRALLAKHSYDQRLNSNQEQLIQALERSLEAYVSIEDVEGKKKLVLTKKPNQLVEYERRIPDYY